jgi:hypothetical protein
MTTRLRRSQISPDHQQWTAGELGKLRSATELLHFGSIASRTPPCAERIAELQAPSLVGDTLAFAGGQPLPPVAVHRL